MPGRQESLEELIRRIDEEWTAGKQKCRQEFLAYRDEIQIQDGELGERLGNLGLGVEESREFNREILLRNEKVYTAVIRRMEKMSQETRSNIEETKAQTQALLRVIDRMDRLDGGPDA